MIAVLHLLRAKGLLKNQAHGPIEQADERPNENLGDLTNAPLENVEAPAEVAAGFAGDGWGIF